MDQALNHYKQWTGPELEVVARDLPASEIARQLGRSLYAVKHMRNLLRVDPRKIDLAGLPTKR